MDGKGFDILLSPKVVDTFFDELKYIKQAARK
jgi:hypothetical protein